MDSKNPSRTISLNPRENTDMCRVFELNWVLFVGTFLPKKSPIAKRSFGIHTAREIPVLIPNTEVKPGRGDYTALRETSKTPIYD